MGKFHELYLPEIPEKAIFKTRGNGFFSQILVLSDGGCGKWEESDIPRPFYGDRQYPLVLGTITRNSPGNDLATFRGEIP